jgi:predicted SAM-dependent methyltransferase
MTVYRALRAYLAYRVSRWIVFRIRSRRALLRTDARLIRNYFSARLTRKLHIGCGEHLLPDWLNADLHPVSLNVLRLDATKRLPFSDNMFDYVFSECMIEHVPYRDGAHLLAECYRVLKPGGRLRIATPDLPFLIALYHRDKTELQREYIRWMTEVYIPYAPYADDTFVINNYVRDWGHQFIYDEKTLRRAFERAGFSAIVTRELNDSEDVALRGLENETRMPPGFLRLETLVVEGAKP